MFIQDDIDIHDDSDDDETEAAITIRITQQQLIHASHA